MTTNDDIPGAAEDPSQCRGSSEASPTPAHGAGRGAPAAPPTHGTKLTPLAYAWRWTELLALYWIIPFFIDFTQKWQGRMLIPGLIVGGVVLFFILRRDPTFDRKSLWNFGAFKKELPRILITAALAFAIMLGFAWFVSEQPWAPTRTWPSESGEPVEVPAVTPLGFLQAPTLLIVMVLVLYPLVSVYPQEIILRTFFFHRYTPLFGKGWGTITASALTFAWVHVIFVADRADPMQWIPVYFCVPAGFLFGYTYWKTKSTIASAAEHGIVGDLMWLSGIGWYFFAGGAVSNGG